MAIALTLQQYLARQRVDYDVVPHAPTLSSMHTAEASHVPGDRLAKAVVLKHDTGYLLAVIPASHRLGLEELQALLQRRTKLATEEEIERLFGDCTPGAVPPIGAAYGMDLIVDDSIAEQPEIYFEGGDHGTLVHMSGDRFAQLTTGAQHGRFSHHG
jgi:Ala-tRNA(Pro) deacylase